MARTNTKRRLSRDKLAPAVEDTRDQILQAAATAFMQQGYAATSIDAVAEVIGSTKGLIYYYFKSKADLFFEVHRDAMERNLGCILPIAVDVTLSNHEKLQQMLVQHALLIMNHFESQRVTVLGVEMHLTASTTPSQRETLTMLMRMRDEYENLFVRVLQAGVKAGEFRSVKPKLASKMLLGGLNWMTIWYHPRASERTSTKVQFAEELVDILMAGVRTS